MSNNNNDQNPQNDVQREYYNSSLYNVIKGFDSKAADDVGKGIGKAVSGVTKAFNSIPQPKNKVNKGNTANYNYTYNYNYSQKRNPNQNQNWNQNQNPNGNNAPGGPYGYNYPGQNHRSSQKYSGNPQNNYYYPGGNPQQPPIPGKIVRQGSNAKFIVAGILCFLYATNFPMYRITDILIMLGVGIAGFFLGKFLFKGKKKVVPDVQPIPQATPAPEPVKKAEAEKPKKAKSDTGNPELDKVIDDGADYIEKLRAANVAIKDPGVSACIDRMEKASLGIFDYIKDKPAKVPQIKKFMNYYLPTTLKLLNSYEKLSRQAVKGENISSTMFDIEGMMQTIATAFEKQLDSLFGDEAMDIQTDITVFEQILQQEGLKEDDKPLNK